MAVESPQQQNSTTSFTPTPPLLPITYLDTTAKTYLWGCLPPTPIPTPHHEKSVRLPFFGFSKIVVNGDYTSAKACACECVGACLEREKRAP